MGKGVIRKNIANSLPEGLFALNWSDGNFIYHLLIYSFPSTTHFYLEVADSCAEQIAGVCLLGQLFGLFSWQAAFVGLALWHDAVGVANLG